MTWTWWMTLLAIFAALVLIGCIPVGVDARYNAEGVFLAAKLGPIRLQLLPQKPKKKKKQQKQQKKPEKAPEKAASQEKKPNPILSGGVDGILQLLDIVLDTLGDLRRKLRVEELTLHVCIGGSDDPAVFNYAMFDFQRLVAAPIVILCGIIIEIVAIMKVFKGDKQGRE